MKKNITKFILLFPLMLSAICLKAQDEFAPIGAEWHYNYNNFSNTGYILIESVSDTIIDSISCRKLVKSINVYDHLDKKIKKGVFGKEYVTQINDSVMIYRYGKLRKLYDLSAEIGDTIIFPGEYAADFGMVDDPSLTYGYALVVDKGFVEIEGDSLKYIDILQENSPWTFSCYVNYNNDYYKCVRICERIGNISGYLLPENNLLADNEEGGALRCYSDDEVSISFDDKGCNYVYDNIDEMLVSDKITIYPNPTKSILNIEFAEENNYIEIYDNIGKKICSLQTNDKSVNINMSEYPSGLYLVVIKNDKGNCFKRIVKN